MRFTVQSVCSLLLACLVLSAAPAQAEPAPASAEGTATTTTQEPTMDEQPAAALPQVQGHPICWIQFTTSDLAQTSKFLTAVFGWQIQPYMDMGDFSVFVAPKGLMGGLQGAAPEGAPAVIPYIYVEDIDLAFASITESGGAKVLDKTEVPGAGGSIALFKDPAGVTYGLSDIEMPVDYTPMPFGSAVTPEANTICSLELYGGDFDQTAKFFGELFTWGATPMGDNYMAFSPGSGVSGVFQNHTPDIPALAYIWSDDLDATVAKVQAAGGTLMGEISAVSEMGRFAYFTDPAGVVFGLIGK